tara:strand:+ start:366 stop:791 length:426 start_codon:yes stop_codon:yes gene_type:complete
MTDTNRSIAKSVALKGATHLLKDKFDINGDLSAQTEKVIAVSDKLYDWLCEGTINAVHAVFETNEVAKENKQVKTVSSSGHTASEGQVKFLRDLFEKLPEEEKSKYSGVVLSNSITWQYAKEHIPIFQELTKNVGKDKPPF